MAADALHPVPAPEVRRTGWMQFSAELPLWSLCLGIFSTLPCTHTHSPSLELSSPSLPSLSHTGARAHTHTHTHTHTYTQVTERGRQSRTRVRDSRQEASARAHLSPAWHPAPRTALAASRAQRWESAPGLGSGYPSARPLVSRAVVPPARFCLSAPGTAPRF